MVAAFREIGRGFGPLENFCRVANIKGLSHTSFDEINNKLGKQRRKKLRTIKKGFADKEKELEEVECYVPGGF